MEYREDLKRKSWDELYRRLTETERTRDFVIAQNKLLHDVRQRLESDAENTRGVLESLRAEMKDEQDALKAVPEPPLFEVGKCYRNKRGELRGPLERKIGELFVWKCKTESGLVETYRADGGWHPIGQSDGDLIPGAVEPVPTWTPWPWLPDGEYVVSFADGKWRCRKQIDGWIGMSFQHARQLVGYTSDPAPGRWHVKDCKATYLGE